MENKLKRAVGAIKLPEDAASRIVDRLAAAPVENPRRRPRIRAVLAFGLAAALLIAGASAAYVELFRNAEIVGGPEDIPEPTYRNAGILHDAPEVGYSYSRPGTGYGEPWSLEDASESFREMYALFGTDEKLGGWVNREPWTHSEVLVGSGDVLVRDDFNASGYVKRDYFPADIALVADEFAPFISVDSGTLNSLASPVPDANLFTVTTDPDGELYEAGITAHYSAGEDGEWFQLHMKYLAQGEWMENNYIFADDWDEAYYYTNEAGLEFLITALGCRVDAECTTAQTSLSVTACYMSTGEVEAVLDCLALPE